MSEWFSGDVTVNGIRMHYYRTGGDKPPLVLSHGATDNGLCWTRLTRALEADYDVIMPDARGHGLSEAPASGYATADQAADLAGLIHALGLRKPSLGGHSMGALTTLRLIADEPDLARCAILEDPPVWITPPTTPPGRESVRDKIRRSVRDAQASDVESTIRRSREHSPLWSDDEWRPWAEAKMQVSRAFMDDLGGGRAITHDWRDLLPLVRCPVLLVTADVDRDAIVTPEAANEAQALQPGLQVIRLRGAGHNIRREQFDAFVAAARAFLATVTRDSATHPTYAS
jgi:N-formylmaleamate deformylase